MFLRQTEAPNLTNSSSFSLSTLTSGLSQVFNAAKQGFAFAKKHPFAAFATFMVYQNVLADAKTYSQNFTCPTVDAVTNQINSQMIEQSDWPCYPEATFGQRADVNFKITHNPYETFTSYIQLNSDCSVQPTLQFAPQIEMAVVNLQNLTGFPSEHFSLLGCRYKINFASPSLNETGCASFTEESECLLFPKNNNYLELSAVLTNDTKCEISNSTFVCQIDKAISPLTGIWQAKDKQYPHITYNNMDNSISYTKEEESCAIQFYGDAGEFFWNGTYALLFDMDMEKMVFINQTTECDPYSFNRYIGFERFSMPDFNTLLLSQENVLFNSSADFDSESRWTTVTTFITLIRVEGGDLFYADSLNNTYRFSSTFNTTQAKIAADKIAEKCHLNLTPVAAPSSLSLFKVKASDGCVTERHEMELAYYTSVAEEILNCTQNAFLAFTESDAMQWPTWVCPPLPGRPTGISSSTAGAQSFSSSTGGSQSSSSTGEAVVSSNPNFWANPLLYLIAGGALVTGLIAGITYQSCRQKKRRAENAVELFEHQYGDDEYNLRRSLI